MSPGSDLHRRESQARQLQRHRVHADFRIDEHIETLAPDGLDPLPQIPGTAFKVGRARHGKLCFLILVGAEIERVKRDALALELSEPAFDNRVPDGMVRKKTANDPDSAGAG